MKKPRSDAKLLNMPVEHKEKLADWLMSGLPYYKALDLVRDDLKVDTSIGALQNFWDTYVGEVLIRQRAEAVRTANMLAEKASEKPGRFDAATIEAIKQKAFELSISPGASPKALGTLFMLILKSRDQELEQMQIDQKIREFEERISAGKSKLKKAMSKGGISPDTLKSMEEAIGLL